MRVTYITEYFPKNESNFVGGVQSRLYYLVTELEKKHQLTIIDRSEGKAAATTGSVWRRLKFQVSAVLRSLKTDADLVEGTNINAYLPAFVSARLKGVMAVATFHDVLGRRWFEHMPLPVAVGGYWLEWISLKLPWDRVIAVSRYTRNQLIKAGMDKDKITIVYAGVDHTTINQLPEKKFSIPTILVASRLVSYKRVQDVIRAFAQIEKRMPKVQLIIVGEGPEKQKLRALVETLGMDSKVAFKGQLSTHQEVLSSIKQAHVFCLPSLVEGFGLVTVEAMACGTPFVNSDLEVTREVSEGGKGGLLYEPGNVAAMAEAIEKLLTHKDLYRRKQREGIDRAKCFSWDQAGQETERIYEETLKKI